MIRQIFIFNKGKVLFSHSYALGLDSKELENVIDVIYSYIIMPMPKKTLHRPISNHQIFHRGEGATYFLLIVDLIDSFDYIDNILKKTTKKFKELFPNPLKIKESSPFKTEFLKFLNQIQRDLHSKVAVVGPDNAGKTTLYNTLKRGQEKKIMHFAKSSLLVIDDLNFDIWDFQIKDNYSLMWSKFIAGSDLIILLFDSKNYESTVIEHFLNLIKKDGRNSKLLIIANKKDLINDEDIEKIKSEFDISDLKSHSLISPEAKSTIIQLIRESLNLRQILPSDLTNLIKEAETLDLEGNISAAIAKYQELIDMSIKNQDFTYIDIFKQKLDDLKLRKKHLEREEKFSAPDQIRFTKKVAVKSLPKTEPISTSISKKLPQKQQTTPEPKISGQITKPEKQPTKPKKLTLKTEDIKKDLKSKIKKIKKSKKKSDIRPIKFRFHVQNITDKIISNKDFNFAMELQNLIVERGSNLTITLCDKYINELLNSLEKPLTFKDLELAADYFVKSEKDF